jgi:hypothetical protein
MGEAMWMGYWVGLCGGAYLFYGCVAGMWAALHEPKPVVAVAFTKDQFALVA